MKLSLCNEVIRELPFERQCALAAALGYKGLEVAPFTLGDDAWRMPASRRAEVRRACSEAGIEVSGLHWLLAAPASLSIATDDRTVWQRSVDVMLSSIELCAELGGTYLVHGSPGQRRVAQPDDAKRVEEAWATAAVSAEKAGVVYCLEPLARPDCNFVNTLGEAEVVVRRIGSPAFRLMVDTLASSLEEKEPVADAIRRWMPTGLMAHVQFNDRNKRGPGEGADKFAPVVEALRDTGYDGWVAMEPFIYEPDGPTCAARMIGYVQGLLEQTV
ncbi:MAG: sugar phosphate isomerase/epimerase [Reyranella sp.]|uniref:sugar phosphate isomerase/epimerase family protein n=1 Tax=Reyranella sp. TaxID=1929291 RepID=UPI00121A1234|nr:sugar phosphate isomerase/epimerase family protein [Reyranella sp.]TAJ94996.1 MAG: sugar phosphate isomerase/epimerase [Reyranella sp.]